MDPSYEALHARGSAVRMEALGSSGEGERGDDAFATSFQEVANAVAWGGIWAREGLDLRDRCLVTVAAVTAQGLTDVLPMHIRGALRNGVTPEQLRETLLHVALYAGFPRASSAMKIASKVLEESP